MKIKHTALIILLLITSNQLPADVSGGGSYSKIQEITRLEISDLEATHIKLPIAITRKDIDSLDLTMKPVDFEIFKEARLRGNQIKYVNPKLGESKEVYSIDIFNTGKQAEGYLGDSTLYTIKAQK